LNVFSFSKLIFPGSKALTKKSINFYTLNAMKPIYHPFIFLAITLACILTSVPASAKAFYVDDSLAYSDSMMVMPTIHLETPNGGEVWQGGTQHNIVWTGTNLSVGVLIDLSIDGGNTWANINGSYTSDIGGSMITWIPQTATQQAKVRVSLQYYPEVFDVSDNVFTINNFIPILLEPWGSMQGAFYPTNRTFIQYFISEIPANHKCNLYFSSDNGTKWDTLAKNLDLNVGTNFYTWDVPDSPSDSCLLKAVDVTDPNIWGISNYFKIYPIPTFSISKTNPLKFVRPDSIITFEYQKSDKGSDYSIRYSADNGKSWSPPNDVKLLDSHGFLSIKAPPVEVDSCLYRIVNYYMPTTGDTSDYLIVRNFPDVPICKVTNESGKKGNMVKWSKPESQYIKDYIVYRETEATDVYEEIGRIPKNEFAAFNDSTALPGQQAYRYCLGYIDFEELEYPLSIAHQTIHLNISQGIDAEWNLIWSPYEGYNVESYNIYKWIDTDNMGLLATVSGNITSFTDYSNSGNHVEYMVEAVNNEICGSQGNRNSTSNIVSNTTFGISPDKAADTEFQVYPNPVDGQLFIKSFIQNEGLSVSLLSSTGMTLIKQQINLFENESFPINVSTFADGIYFLQLMGNKKSINKKIVIKH
jgi:hypothetical protein